MKHIFVLVQEQTPRLKYVLDWLLKERLGLDYAFCSDTASCSADALIIAYGKEGGHIHIPNTGLLFEQGIARQDIQPGTWKEIPVLYAIPGGNLPFDLFSAIFFLLSRYEEYLPFPPDKHGRFPAEQSVLYPNKLLERPVVDEWVHAFGKLLEEHGVSLKFPAYHYLPTYDIDMAWAYRHKGWLRTLGGYIRDAAMQRFPEMLQRTRVLSGNQQDPYDSFLLIEELAKQHQPLLFILAARQNGTYDKHMLPSHPAMHRLIADIAGRYPVGLHPSYYTSEQEHLLKEEQQIMERITGVPIRRSRQHYIRFRLPDTYRQLLHAGIQQDYSMGYGTHLGFRAGTGNDFYWYDLHKEQQTTLRVFPFCFMDTTANFELKLDAATAFTRLNEMKQKIQVTGGMLVTIFHNFSLGTAAEWKGWREHYRQWMNS